MSKTRRSVAKGQKAVPVRVKFKVGGRKNPVSALQLTNDELLTKLEKGGKDSVKARQVLDMRDVSYPTKAQMKQAKVI